MDNFTYTILILVTVTLFLFIWQLRRRRKGSMRMKQDNTGYWRYHKDTIFEKQLAWNKKTKKTEQKKHKSEKQSVAVLNFAGDIKAKARKELAQLIDEVILNEEKLTEVVIIVDSPGGTVTGYGHAFAEIERLRNIDIQITVCIDAVAASGGYLMSLPAHKIIAAPFAVIGSIGVIAFIPNFRKLLLDWQINPRTFLAGKFKRTVTLTDDANAEEISHFQEQLEAIHRLFIGAVQKYRPQANMQFVETGDHWTARESIDLNLGLIDQIATSQDYLLQKNRNVDLVFIKQKHNVWESGINSLFASLVDNVSSRLFSFFFRNINF
ncbi:MAG: S49 family peptidase [Deltaproteobacteria bacterium]|nr:S49 family peptidase [Deltaproteobacteria bacterium]